MAQIVQRSIAKTCLIHRVWCYRCFFIPFVYELYSLALAIF